MSKKKGLSMEDTAKALRAAYSPTHAPKKPVKMVRVGWMVTRRMSDVPVFFTTNPWECGAMNYGDTATPIYAKKESK